MFLVRFFCHFLCHSMFFFAIFLLFTFQHRKKPRLFIILFYFISYSYDSLSSKAHKPSTNYKISFIEMLVSNGNCVKWTIIIVSSNDSLFECQRNNILEFMALVRQRFPFSFTVSVCVILFYGRHNRNKIVFRIVSLSLSLSIQNTNSKYKYK